MSPEWANRAITAGALVLLALPVAVFVAGCWASYKLDPYIKAMPFVQRWIVYFVLMALVFTAPVATWQFIVWGEQLVLGEPLR